VADVEPQVNNYYLIRQGQNGSLLPLFSTGQQKSPVAGA
jgi:hypothetical protein